MDAAGLYTSGLIALAEGNEAGARRDLRASFDLYPSNPMAREWLVNDALARQEQAFRSGDLASALDILEEGLAVAPENPLILIRQAGILSIQQEWSEAAQKCQLVLDRDPGNTHARTLLGSIQFQAGQFAEAEATFRRGLEDAPNDRELQRWLQRCLAERARGPSAMVIP